MVKIGLMEKELEEYRKFVCEQVDNLRKYYACTGYVLKRRNEDNDFPAIIACGSFEKIVACGRSMSSALPAYNIKYRTYTPLVEYELHNSGVKRGLLPSFKPPYVGGGLFYGTCAEDEVANNVIEMWEYKHGLPFPTKLTDIAFITPIRPRTGEKREFCEICKELFNV